MTAEATSIETDVLDDPNYGKPEVAIDEKKRTYVRIRGVPGGPPGEEFIILSRHPEPSKDEDEIYNVGKGDEQILRSYSKDRHFLNSRRFPEGLEIGRVNHYTDTGVGQPFVEKSECQVTPDQYDRLRAYANDQAYLSMQERRRYAEESSQWVKEQSAARTVRPGTKSPSEALADIGSDRMEARIAEMVAKGIATEMAKQNASSKPKNGPKPKAEPLPPGDILDP